VVAIQASAGATMSLLDCGGVRLGIERAGQGQPLVLVHGSWSERSTWNPVYCSLAEHFHTVRYDRRGYGESQRPGAGPAAQVMDLLSLIQTLQLQSVCLVGNSMGGIIAAGAALRAPDRVRRVIIHEPPLFGLLSTSEYPDVAARTRRALDAALEAVRAGNHPRAAQIYVEEVSGAAGAWPYLPPDIQRGFVENAGGFLGDATAGQEYEPSLADLRQLEQRLVVTRGIRSPEFLKIIADRLWSELADTAKLTFSAAGHVPHQTCPRDFAGAIVKLAAEPG